MRTAALVAILLLAAAVGGNAAEGIPVEGAFLERLDSETNEAAAEIVAALRERNAELFRDGAPPVDIGVFPVFFSDGGVLELGRIAQTRMIAALAGQAGVNVMGEMAFLNAGYAVKGTFTPPVQGVVEFTWILERRAGDIHSDFKTLHSASVRLRLPGDAASRRNLLLYIQKPEGASDLPDLNVPLLEVAVEVAALRKERGEKKEIALPDGGWLAADDQFRVCLKPNTDCYAYVFLRDSAGELYSLFPAPGIGLSNRLEGGVAHWVPEATREEGVRWFYLDDNQGMETLYMVADYEPIHNVDALLARVSGGEESAEDVEKALGAWAAANHDGGHRRFRVFDGASLRRLGDDFSLVRKFTIEHR